MKNNTLIHVGFSKCASTSLQQGFFKKLSGISYLGRGMDVDGSSRSAYEALFKIASLSERDYQDQESAVRKAVLGFAGDKGLRVISCEFFTSSSYCPFQNIIWCDVSLVARRLYSLFPEAKICMIIRNQLDIWPSIYSEISKRKGVDVSWKDYMDSAIDFVEKERGSALRRLNYYQVYRTYVEIFGAENVTIIPMETFIKDKAGVLTLLAELCGITNLENISEYCSKKRNNRASYLDLSVKRNIKKANKWAEYLPKGIRRGIKNSFNLLNEYSPRPKYKFSEAQREYLKGFYAKGNKLLSEETGIDLKRLGYPC